MSQVRRWGPWVLLVAVATVALTLGLHQTSHPSLDGQVTHIASEVRCPVCDGETAAQSSAPASVQIRDQIRTELLAHESSSQILDGLVASYGQTILEKPPAQGVALIVWVLPVVAFVLGAAGLGFALWRWRLKAQPVAAPAAGAAAPVALPTRSRSRAGRWAVFGVGVALIAGGGSWALVSAVSARQPGQTITGQDVDPNTVLTDLQQAQQEAASGQDLDAIKEYQKVLVADPAQPNALVGEGWLLAETQQPSLVQQGVAMLTEAEHADPTYAPAHVYRGIALLSEDDYAASIPELRWYMAHDPDPQLAPRVRQALAEAQADLASSASANAKGGG